MRKIKVGLVGYGFSGATFHAPFLSVLKEYELTKVVSSKKKEVQKDLGNVVVVGSLEEVLEDQTTDLVIITTPSGMHFEMAKQSLMAGKHVILEKPMVVKTWEAEELIKIASGPGSGILYDLGSHLIDQALHLFGWPQFVSADVFAQREKAETDDYFHITLGYDKLRVILHSGSIVPESGPRFQVHGTKGSFIKYGLDGQESALIAGKKPTDYTWGADDPQFYGELHTVDGEEVKQELIETLNGSYTTYYEKFAENVLEGKCLPVTAYEGLSVIKIIEAAFQSSKEKKVILV
ncbi:Gfo/Idh/MocA family oxidoreductase [Thalassobacillus sp. B23F22_16]|uniref:Gfo/Idh/MocA family oxidoreductase n=1 Tax=Thalassobacillus sp. B23F22_16 TaxID=3459513 RepID=UPI00373F0697